MQSVLLAGTSGALGYAKENKILPLAVSEHVLCLWRTFHAVLPASKARQIHFAQESTITNCMAMVNATVALVQINKVQRKNS